MLQLSDRDDLVAATETARRMVREEPVPSPESRRLSVPLERSDQAIDVLVALREQGVGIESLTVQKPSLDEVFMALTGHGAGTDPADSMSSTTTQPELEAAS